jgi:cell division septal protein FtsQ
VSPVAVPSDKRFRRAHVKPAHQRSSWGRWSLRVVRSAAIAAVFLYGGYRGLVSVAQAHALQIDRITVRGNQRMSPGEVLAVLDGLRGQSLLWTDLEIWRRRLLSSPWVHDADFRRSLPSTVEVAISERQPVGIGRIKGQLYLVDGRGVLIDEYGPRYAELELPIIDGLPDPGDTGTTDAARIDLAARVIASVSAKPDIAKRLSQIDVRDVHNAVVILTGESELLQLGDQQFLRRIQSYVELAPTLRAKVAGIDVVDLRFDGRVYVTPAGSPARGRTPAAKTTR